jgi:hypothetical protein
MSCKSCPNADLTCNEINSNAELLSTRAISLSTKALADNKQTFRGILCAAFITMIGDYLNREPGAIPLAE